MGTVTWNTKVNAPCCPGEIVDNTEYYECGFDVCTCDPKCDRDQQSILIQTDWDYPGVASVFGWSIQDVQVMQARYYGVVCGHNGTDGTVDCPDCGLTAGTFIEAAGAWLRANNGVTVDDPGYFS